MISTRKPDRRVLRGFIAVALLAGAIVVTPGCISVVDFSTRKGVRGDQVKATTLVSHQSDRSGSPTAAVRTGSWGFISGCVAEANAPGESFEDEAHAAFEQLQNELERADLALRDVVSVTVYLTDFDNQHDVTARTFCETFPTSPPVLSCVEVRRLIDDARIQIDVVARDQNWREDDADADADDIVVDDD